MFRRAFWFTAGAVAGVWVTTRVQRTVRGLAPDALAARAAGRALEAGQRLRDFAHEVRAGMTQRETELREVLGLTAAPPEELPPVTLPAQVTATPRRRAALAVARHGAGERDVGHTADAPPARDAAARRRTTVDHRTTGLTGTTGKEDH